MKEHLHLGISSCLPLVPVLLLLLPSNYSQFSSSMNQSQPRSDNTASPSNLLVVLHLTEGESSFHDGLVGPTLWGPFLLLTSFLVLPLASQGPSQIKCSRYPADFLCLWAVKAPQVPHSILPASGLCSNLTWSGSLQSSLSVTNKDLPTLPASPISDLFVLIALLAM